MFGYYTQKDTYGAYIGYNGETRTVTGTDKTANFMYNQRVYWTGVGKASDGSAANQNDGNITGWYYEPIKYWPNESSSSGLVDNQTDGAPTTEYDNAGNLSFFAYAPYVYVTTDSEAKNADDNTAATLGKEKKSDGANDSYEKTGTGEEQSGKNGSGIVSITANNVSSAPFDPIITYVIPQNNDGFVDLLWGTMMKGGASENVVEDATPGVTGTSTSSFFDAASPYTASYQNSILKDYTMNVDLSKQKTAGTVGFLFKHALGILGGSYKEGTQSNGDFRMGFQVVLDNDLSGAISGGKKGKETVVLIEYIKVDAISYADVNGDGVLDDDELSNPVTSHQGKFNLATGKWDIDYYDASASSRMRKAGKKTPTEPVHQYQYIIPKTSGTPAGKVVDAWSGGGAKDKFYLNTVLHEVSSVSTVNAGSDEKTGYVNASGHVGVLNTPQDVYDTGGDYDPLAFFPGTFPELTITVKYIVRTEDKNLSKGYSEVTQEIKKVLTVQEAIQLNKKYNLLMHLGLTSVKFTAQVDDWDDLGNNNRDTDGDGTLDMRVSDDIYLPINVGGGSMNDGIAENITIDYNADALSVALSGLVSGKEYTIAKGGGFTSSTTNQIVDVVYASTKTAGKGTDNTTFTAAGLQEIISLSKLPQATADKTYTITVTGPYLDENNEEQANGTKVYNITKTKAPLVLTPHASVIAADVDNAYKLTVDITLPDGTKVTETTTTGKFNNSETGVDKSTAGKLTITNLGKNTTSSNKEYEIYAKVGDSEGTTIVVQSAAAMSLTATDNGGSTDLTNGANKLAKDKSIIKISVAGFSPTETLTASNTEVTFTSTGGNTLSELTNYSYGDSYVQFEVGHNTGATEDRTMVFTVKVNDAVQKITVVQAYE